MPKTAPKPQLTAITALSRWCWDMATGTGQTDIEAAAKQGMDRLNDRPRDDLE